MIKAEKNHAIIQGGIRWALPVSVLIIRTVLLQSGLTNEEGFLAFLNSGEKIDGFCIQRHRSVFWETTTVCPALYLFSNGNSIYETKTAFSKVEIISILHYCWLLAHSTVWCVFLFLQICMAVRDILSFWLQLSMTTIWNFIRVCCTFVFRRLRPVKTVWRKDAQWLAG